MENSESSASFSSMNGDLPKQSLRRRAAEGLRLSLSKPISTLFHRHGNLSETEESPKQQAPTGKADVPARAPRTPASLTSARSLFGSLCSNKHSSIASNMSFDKDSAVGKPKAIFSNSPKSLRTRFRRTFSRSEFVQTEHSSSSPIDIPIVKIDIDPLQRPIPSGLTDGSRNPLQERMLNSPRRDYFSSSSPSDSGGHLSPPFQQHPVLSPMPGTTFPLDDLSERQVPFEQAYDQIAQQKYQFPLDTKPVRDSSDPFVDSPKPQHSQNGSSLRVPRLRGPPKSAAALGKIHLNSDPNNNQAGHAPLAENQNRTRLSDEDTLKEMNLSEVDEDKSDSCIGQKSPTGYPRANPDSKVPQKVYQAGIKPNITRIKSMPDALAAQKKTTLPDNKPEPVQVVRKSVKYVNESIFFGQRTERPLITRHSVARFPLISKQTHPTFNSASVDCSTDSDDSSVFKCRRYERKSKSSSDESSWLSTTTVDADEAVNCDKLDGEPLMQVLRQSVQVTGSETATSTNDSIG